jgi:hypothetical protein
MNLRAFHTVTVFSLSAALGLSLSACGSDANVGDASQGQNNKGTGGSTQTNPGTGGSVTNPATGGSSGTTGGGTGGAIASTGGAGQGGATTGGIQCGKNTCGAGQYCCNESCGTCAPMGAMCTAIACVPDPTPGACKADSDCSLQSDYCGGCNCRVTGEVAPPCTGPMVECFADPCMNTTAACVNGTCQKVKPLPTESQCTTDADCTLVADYCTGCDCRALGPGESLPKCAGPGVSCLVDPCGTKTAACVGGMCVAN